MKYIVLAFTIAFLPLVANVTHHDRKHNTIKVDQFGSFFDQRPKPKSNPLKPHRKHTKKDFDQIITGN